MTGTIPGHLPAGIPTGAFYARFKEWAEGAGIRNMPARNTIIQRQTGSGNLSDITQTGGNFLQHTQTGNGRGLGITQSPGAAAIVTQN